MATKHVRVYTVRSMTCGHCRTAVIEEVKRVDGIAGVEVELETGRLTVRGEDFGDEAIAQAVEEAGYSVGGAR